MTLATRCGQPRCTGAVQDGYCDVCGLPPAPPPPEPPPPEPVPPQPNAATPLGRRGALGLGLVRMPAVPFRDPESAVLTDPQVAENRRFCGGCGAPVGRGKDGVPGRTEGFCPKCRTPYAFTPKLAPGDLVGGQYEVVGCLAHGGLGWIYLARDRNVNDRWVVLKGLLDTGDADAMAAAVAERRFLATVEHPGIVRIYNFVRHGGDGYIVMEYVGGRSLRELALEHRAATGAALPLPQVLAYALEVLRALGHLHDEGLLYCDFKPANAIQTGDRLHLIDLGGVRRAGDPDGAIYGTVGFQAPEIAEAGPSVGSDLYTVARTMAVLAFDFTGFTSTYRESLPPREKVPLLQRHESFDLLLRRAAHRDPARRFTSAAEMAEQLTGVLREVLAAEDGEPRPAASARFGPEVKAAGARIGALPGAAWLVDALPLPLVDDGDPAAAYLAGLAAASPSEVVATLAHPYVSSVEVDLRLAHAHISMGDHKRAREVLAGIPGDWRVGWYLALAALAAGDVAEAAARFQAVRELLPGELAPSLALAYCAELRADHAPAERGYARVWRTDRGHVSAAFGLARVRFAAGDRYGAEEALLSVPPLAGRYGEARVGAIVARLSGRDPAGLSLTELLECGARLEDLTLDAGRRDRLTVLVLEAALGYVRIQGAPPSGTGVLGAEFTERSLRLALERRYRALARAADGRAERRGLTGRANAVRPRTLF
ncbi:serine/threonine-protein kinase [Actinomadura macrotermitis]|uniref:non-specific serine/threonine protein kinase n=1 Tax=Actinomadura macrotermitis TaxID=2585200 RepID=A0A7K0C3W1_9ACTN|nr:serine/threonine-protein kinase [Actinomadura macrotermitis]MQY08113.1 Serine/threonine-protein kinase PknG [Actinomadura macrotermitis]